MELHIFTPDLPGTSLTLRQAIELYIADKTLQFQAGAFSGKSLERARYYLTSFSDFRLNGHALGDQPAGAGHSSDLTHWLVAHPDWNATATKSSAVSQIMACFRWLEAGGHCKNPYRRPRFLGPPMRPRPAITPEEYQRMRLASRGALTPGGRPRRTRWAFRAMLTFLWKTGCRTCEARAVRWDQLDWMRAVIELDRHKTDRTGDTRQIPVRRVMQLLRWLYARRRPGQEHIFTNTLNRPWACCVFAKEFRRYAELAGVRKSVSAYCLRHGLAVRLIEAGVSDRAIADVLGHTTTRYVSWYGRSTRSRSDHLNNVLRRDR